jgi:hypothetical protein
MRKLALLFVLALAAQAQILQPILQPILLGAVSNANGYAKGAVFTFNVRPASDLPAFPNLISGTYTQLADIAHGGNVNNTVSLNGQTVPADLIFTSDSSGTALLNWEIESWNNTTGAIVAWVQSNRSSSADTLIYAWVGKSSVTTYQGNATSTWDSNYKGIYHLASAASMPDSSSAANALTPSSSPSAAAGKVDGAVSFASSNQNTGPYAVAGANSGILAGARTMSAWVCLSSYIGEDDYTAAFLFVNNGGASWGPSLSITSSTSVIAYWDGGVDGTYNTPGSTVLSTGAWHYLVGVMDAFGSGSLIRLYIDGVQDSTVTQGYSGPAMPDGPLMLNSDWNARRQNVKLDEVRISATNRSTDWIAHEYRQQNQASAWYTVGSWN